VSEGALQTLINFKIGTEIISSHMPVMLILEYGVGEEISSTVGVAAQTKISPSISGGKVGNKSSWIVWVTVGVHYAFWG
jgi:hypothetical protein